MNLLIWRGKLQLSGRPSMREPLSLDQLTGQLAEKLALSEVQHVLHRDYETRSCVTLKKVGAHRYAADPSTEILCAAFAVDDGPVQLWLPGDPVPPEFVEAARNTNWLVAAHNDAFETAIEQYILVPRFNFPLIPLERHRCTMAAALAVGLPAKLSAVAAALELSNRKDAAGERLMHQMSKPRRARKDEDPAGTYWFDNPDRLERLYSYCRQDVEVEREIYEGVPPLSPSEQSLWQLSCVINNRGFCVDRPFAEAARRVAKAAAPEIDAELAELTGGAVTGINQIARMQNWLKTQGCSVKSLDKKIIEKLLLNTELPPLVLRVLELRAGGAPPSKSSMRCCCAPATTTVFVAPSNSTAPPPVAGLEKVF